MRYLLSGVASILLTTVALSSAHGHRGIRNDAAHHGHGIGAYRGHHRLR